MSVGDQMTWTTIRKRKLSQLKKLALVSGGLSFLAAGLGFVACSRSQDASQPKPSKGSLRMCFRGALGDCKKPDEIAEMLRDPELRIVDAGATPGGQQGAFLFNLRLGKNRLRAKWRTLGAQTLLATLGDPRRELVGYQLQKMFFEEKDYVVPPTVTHCFPLEEYKRKVNSHAIGTWSGAPCVFGFLSFWIPDVETVAESIENEPHRTTLFDAERFAKDQEYARALSAMNLLTFVIKHADSHASQFVVQENPFHVWSIDHSVSLTSMKNPMVLFEEDWSRWVVPKLDEDIAHRVSQVTHSDVDKLTVLEVLDLPDGRTMEAGRPVDVDEPGEGRDVEVTRRGSQVFVGTKKSERQLIWEKIQETQKRLRSKERPDLADL